MFPTELNSDNALQCWEHFQTVCLFKQLVGFWPLQFIISCLYCKLLRLWNHSVGRGFVHCKYTPSHIYVCLSPENMCCGACPQKSLSPLLAAGGIETSMFTLSSYMMAPWSFSTLQNEHRLGFALFSALGKAFSVQFCRSCTPCLLHLT